MLKRSETYTNELNNFNRTNSLKTLTTTKAQLPKRSSSSTSIAHKDHDRLPTTTSTTVTTLTSSLVSPRLYKPKYNQTSLSTLSSLSSRVKNTNTSELKVEQVASHTNKIRLTANELSSSLNLNKFTTNKNDNKMKGMTIGKMILMSNGERTKQFENRMQDRLLNKQLEAIEKQAAQIEIQMKRARSLILDEYMQTKATNTIIKTKRTNGNNIEQKPPLPKNSLNTFCLPSYLKNVKQKQIINYDYQEHLERHKKVSLNNRNVCSRHKRHLIGGEFTLTNMTYEELEKFKEQYVPKPIEQIQQIQTQLEEPKTTQTNEITIESFSQQLEQEINVNNNINT
jgi:hypothetical protein